VGVQGDNARDQGVPPLRRWSFWRRLLAELLRQGALLFIAFLLLTVPPNVPGPPAASLPRQDPPPVPPRPDLSKLRQALDADDNAAVLAYFRKLPLSDKDRAAIRTLIARLGDESFAVRERAAREVLDWGPRAAASLRRAARSSDPETAARARDCLGKILAGSVSAQLVEAVHRLENRPPAGTAAVLLDCVPDAEDESLADALQSAIAVLAIRDGKADEVLIKALTDPLPERRAAAGLALCQPATKAHREAVSKLLGDPDPEVRRRVALALVDVGEKTALPVLIDLLGELPPEEAWPIADLLAAVAGARAPAVAPGQDAQGRDRCRAAWSAWWRTHGAEAILVSTRLPPRGPTLLVYLDAGSQEGNGVAEVGPDQALRWRTEGLEYPLYAEPLSEDRFLVAEFKGERISERNSSGEVLWSKELNRPVLSAQRLPNGHTFVVYRNGVAELDRDGKEVSSFRRPVRDLVAARRLPSGEAVLLTDRGDCVFVDAAGREMGRFATGARQVLGAGFEALPNRCVVVPHFSEDKVVEYGPAAEVLWQTTVRKPTGVQRLSGGRTLVVSTETSEVVEIDRFGKELWKYKASARPVCARRRGTE
jgi:HEAT repeat protein